ncbi:MAG TPA: hypothetical protein VIT42_14890 [Microlunatus sp.]
MFFGLPGVGWRFVRLEEWVQPFVPVLGLAVLVLVGVVLVVAQQLEGVDGLGEDADRLGAAHVDRVGVAVQAEDLGDPLPSACATRASTCLACSSVRCRVVLAMYRA